MAINESETAKETYEKISHKLKTDKKVKFEKLVGETFPVVEQCVNALYKNKDYQLCTHYDKLLIELNENYHKGYARLFECYSKLGQSENAIIYGQMLRLKFDKKIIDKYYRKLIPLIEEEKQKVIENIKNPKENTINHESNAMIYMKFILCVLPILYYIYTCGF